jgi:ompA family protein
MKSSGIILTILLLFPLLSLAAQEQANTAYVFRFMADKDMFYVPYNGNGKELTRLKTCVGQYKEGILAGNIPLHVDGYCKSAPTEKENRSIAKLRSNRVKSELITSIGLNETCFVTCNHSGEGDYVTVRFVVPKAGTDTVNAKREHAVQTHLKAEQQAEPECIAQEQAERKRPVKEEAEKETVWKAETERLAADEVLHGNLMEATSPNPSIGWYAGIQGGVPFGMSALSSFGADKNRAGWSMGIYGGYRFNPVLSLEIQAAWGQPRLSTRSCCPDYWLGSDGHLYEGAVAGMTGWNWHNLKSNVRVQRYGVQLGVNLLGFFTATRKSRWILELAPHLYAIGTKAEFRTLGDDAPAMKGTSRWHLGAGGNLQAGYAITKHLSLNIYTGITYLTGQMLDGTLSHRHKANYIWENGLKLGWYFGNIHKGKEANK